MLSKDWGSRGYLIYGIMSPVRRARFKWAQCAHLNLYSSDEYSSILIRIGEVTGKNSVSRLSGLATLSIFSWAPSDHNWTEMSRQIIGVEGRGINSLYSPWNHSHISVSHWSIPFVVTFTVSVPGDTDKFHLSLCTIPAPQHITIIIFLDIFYIFE